MLHEAELLPRCHGSAECGYSNLMNVYRFFCLLIFLSFSLSSCGSQGASEANSEENRSSTTIIETRPSLVDEDAPDWFGEPVNLHDLDQGDCFNMYAWVSNDRHIELNTHVPCNGPHQFEIYRLVQHPARNGAVWPGDEEMTAFAVSQCYESFEEFVGIIYELSELEINYLTPNRTNFEHEIAQFRGVHCYLFQDDGSELLGSAKQSFR
ncbi:MAG: hypothetical protein CL439_05750 [Acidimicrobiaceae bacterium]|nr:hypothetical protein [Acidimicrobiaceae bacterium]